VVSEQEVWIPAGGYNVTQAQIQAPDEPGTYAVGVLANPNRDRPPTKRLTTTTTPRGTWRSGSLLLPVRTG